MRQASLAVLGIVILFSFIETAHAQTQDAVNININTLTPRSSATIFLSPRTATFSEGATFEVPIFLDTKGQSINAVELHIKFDASKLTIINPSGDRSIIGIWLEPPTYDNTNGSAKLLGVIPNGIVTDSGLIATMTFRAKATGQAIVSFASNSHVLLNDGLGTEIPAELDRGTYSILPKPPGGVVVFSETHPFQDRWYNNNSPVLAWEKNPGVSAFSFVLDNKPFTVPDNNPMTGDTVKSYPDLENGLWYFHIKALKDGIWGAATHFLIRVDTIPPAEFKTEINSLDKKTLVSFLTTDNLSGIDHYEVGIVENAKSPTESPVFIQTESPYLLPLIVSKKTKIIIRAFDRAGNVRESAVNVQALPLFLKFIRDHLTIFLLGVLALIIGLFAIHYLYGHRILAHLRRVMALMKKEEEVDVKDEHKELEEHSPKDP